jgi:hypothetical protein
VTLLTPVLERITALEIVVMKALCHLCLGEAHLQAHPPVEAYAFAERALAFACEYHERGHQAYALRLLGEIAIRREPSQPEQAEVHYQEALALAIELSMRPLQAHCHHGLGRLYRRAGQQVLSHAELFAAIALYRAMEMTFWLPETEAALAEVQGNADRL